MQNDIVGSVTSLQIQLDNTLLKNLFMFLAAK